ncbi:hypothetical protein CMI47_03905 [Candidatus Pacearchaeota archaeon]|nr:hypothetical protein [Candidatus Pacearchaeota archaeon]|tara:strand:- start:745 stop:1056 length:312 start_codon:yes stop_codon:yes gene_type:complete
MTTIYLIITLVISIVLNIALSMMLYKLGKIIISFEDTVEASIPVINKAEKVLSDIMERPLFFDSPEVRGVLNSIRSVRYAVLTIASNFNIVKEEEISESTDKR